MAADSSPLMTVSEVATALRVDVTTVRRLIHRRELRAVRIGKLWRIPSSEVERLATPVDAPRKVGYREPAVAEVVSQPPVLGEGPSIRIFSCRPWESDDNSAAPSAAGRGRSTGNRASR